MDAKPHWLKRRLGNGVFLLAFFLVLVLSDWLVYAASFAVFRYDPAAVPDNFFMVARAPAPGRGELYRAFAWSRYPGVKAEYGVQSFLLPEAEGSIRGKATFSFAVLENDGERQVIEVRFEGPYRSVSRYEAHKDRVRPIAYRSLTWGRETERDFTVFVVVLVLAVIVAVGAALGVERLQRLQRT